jgi:hypothetical protein
VNNVIGNNKKKKIKFAIPGHNAIDESFLATKEIGYYNNFVSRYGKFSKILCVEWKSNLKILSVTGSLHQCEKLRFT